MTVCAGPLAGPQWREAQSWYVSDPAGGGDAAGDSMQATKWLPDSWPMGVTSRGGVTPFISWASPGKAMANYQQGLV